MREDLSTATQAWDKHIFAPGYLYVKMVDLSQLASIPLGVSQNLILAPRLPAS